MNKKRWLEVAIVATFAAYLLVHGASLAFVRELPGLDVIALVFTVFGLLHAVYMLGWRRAAAFFGICVVLSWTAEKVSLLTGIAGEYYYTDVLGPMLGDVPYVIPLTWFLMMYPSYVIANLAVSRRATFARCSVPFTIWLSALTAVVMTAWDLALDPYMTQVVGAWVWVGCESCPYFGVPYSNYYSWVVTTFLIVLVYRMVERRLPLSPVGLEGSLWVAALPVGIYAMNTISSAVIGSPVETRLIAAFAMGVPVLVAATRIVQGRPPASGPLVASVASAPGGVS
ncbi:MAG TPA: carotenoid biosynthesis protein [Thermoanaerobaculia bacterium]|nr:carotenoid biosynthesis protein [Thermoanaerobaculia bacterium]